MKYKAFEPDEKKIDEKARTIEHIISTDKPDLDGDILEAGGWTLDRFKKNPVVLFGHNHDIPPIGRATSIEVMEHGLRAVTQFPPIGVHSLADTVFDLNRHGYLQMWSVGFIPKSVEPREDGKGMHIMEQELVEYSGVNVPANDDAINLAISKGLVTDKTLPLLGWVKGGFVKPLKSLSEIIQEEFSKQTIALAFGAECQRSEEALRKASGARA